MIYRKHCKDSRGILLVDMLVAISVSAICVLAVLEMTNGSADLFRRSLAREKLIQEFEAGDLRNVTVSSSLYGNDRIEEMSNFSSSSLSFRRIINIDNNLLGNRFSSTICSPRFEDIKSIHPRMLPIDPILPLTDIQVRQERAYVASDSSTFADPDISIFDISRDHDPQVLSSLNTGPGISQIALGGKYIFAAAASSAFQLHILSIGDDKSLSLVNKFTLPLPASTSPPIGSAIAIKDDLVILGTDKWDSREFLIIKVTDIMNPEVIGAFEVGSKINHIEVKGDFAFVSASGSNQVILLDISDPRNVMQTDAFIPSGWQRQIGIRTSWFEDSLLFARNSGGFNIPRDHEVFIWPNLDIRVDGLLNSSEYSSFDEAGGVYGIGASKTSLILATREIDSEIKVINREIATTSLKKSFSLPVAPETMTCNLDKLYILAKTAPVIYEITLQ